MIRPFRVTRLLSGLLAVAIGAALAALGSPIAVEPVARVLLATLFLVAGGRALLADAQASSALDARRERGGPVAARPRTAFLPLAVLFLALGAWQGFAAVQARGWPLLWLGSATVLLAVAFSRGPSLRERGLGEVASFLLFGPLPVLAGFVAASGRFSWVAVAGALPLGLLATACFVAATCGEPVGRDRRRRGWAAAFPRPALERAFLVLIALSYAWVCYGAARGFYPVSALAVLVTIPWGARAYAALRHPPGAAEEGHPVADHAVAAYLAFAGVLFAALVLHLTMGARAV